jgi:hypothetical protein
MLDWEWADDPGTVSLWVHLLLRANYEKGKWRGIVIKRGQLVTSVESLSLQTGLTKKQIRTRLDRLVESGCLGRQTANNYTLLTICKYGDYQNIPNNEGKQTANKGQSKGNQRATNNKNNNNNNTTPTPTPAREEENSREEKNKEWQGSEVVTENDIPPLTDLWVEEIKLLITRQLKRTISECEISEHYQDFIAQERSPYLQVLYSEWRNHFKRYIRKRLKAIKDETSTANRQHLSRDEQRKREADARKQRAAEHVAELTSTCT